MKKYILIINLLIITGLLSLTAQAAQPVANQLTNNNFEDNDPSMNDGAIAWSGYDGNFYQIYYWNGRSTTQITFTNFNNYSPSLYKGTIAWYGGPSQNDHEIYYYDGFQTSRITNNNYPDEFPSLYDGKIAWQGQNGSDWEIFYFNGSNIVQVTNDNVDEQHPSLYNGMIAYEKWDGADYEIFLWNGTTQRRVTEQRVSDNNFDDYRPSLYDGKIAWYGDDGNDYEIYYWDGNVITEVTRNNVNDMYPSLYAGTVVYTAQDGSFQHLFFWNGSTNEQVTFGNFNDTKPSLFNGNVAWVRDTSGPAGAGGQFNEIFFATIQSLEITPAAVTVEVGSTSTSTISGGASPYLAVSSNPRVVAASLNGASVIVSGISPGTANVSVTDAESQSKTIAVTVLAGSPTTGSLPILSVAVSDTMLTIAWTPAQDATGYRLYYAPPDLSSVGSIDVGTLLGGDLQLPRGTSMLLLVEAYNRAGSLGFSNIASFVIPSTPPNPFIF